MNPWPGSWGPLERVGAFTRPGESGEKRFLCRFWDLVVFGMPTYAGKLPNKMLPYVQQQIHGNGALAVGVVTFGNRSYDNSLAELCAGLEAGGFHRGGRGLCLPPRLYRRPGRRPSRLG